MQNVDPSKQHTDNIMVRTGRDLSVLFNEFYNSEKAGGLVLVFVTVLSLGLANSSLQKEYLAFWHLSLGGHDIVHWINDGIMTIFFLLIGLELEREIYLGELSDFKNASLPVFAALGGMLVPAGLFVMLTLGTDYSSGAGIPMATDIAFAVGILSLLGNRVPPSLKIFLTALAVADDLGAILIIAVFYTTSLVYANLFIALGIFGILIVLNRMKVNKLLPYLAGGGAMWYFMLNSGVHPTVVGVLLAFAIPFGDGSEKSPSYILQHFLHKPVAFLILPLFAIANTCIPIAGNFLYGLSQRYTLGIIAGLVIGKPLGIWLFSFIAVSLRFCKLPDGLNWKRITGAGFLGGIGFTMSIFITLLSFEDAYIVKTSKIAILMASVIAGITGYIWLRRSLREA
jgi:NhaA family Na+:H+ antiporter